MKKIVLRVVIGVLVLLLLAVLAVNLFLDNAVKRGVETIGSRVTQVKVELDGVNLSLLSGSGSIKGLSVANPEGFKTPHAIRVGSASLSLESGSLLSDKVVIKSIQVEAPEITLEGGLQGNNLSKLQANVEASTGDPDAEAPADEEGEPRKLQVNELVIRDAKLNVAITELGDRVLPVTLSEIRLTDLGAGPEGITSAELTRRVLAVITEKALEAAKTAMADALKSGAVQDAGKAAGDTIEKVGKGVQDLLRRNPSE